METPNNAPSIRVRPPGDKKAHAHTPTTVPPSIRIAPPQPTQPEKKESDENDSN